MESRKSMHFTNKLKKNAICSKECGWAYQAVSHLPMVSENDKARKVRKKRKNDIIYSRLRVNVAAKQFKTVWPNIIHQRSLG